MTRKSFRPGCLAFSLRRVTLMLRPLVFVLALATFKASAQLPTATILGIVRDSSGAVIASVTLRAQNVETGFARSTMSAVDGSFRFSALPIGPYELRAEYAGFRAEVRSGITLAVAQEAVVNFTLQVGEVTQAVEVTAEAPLVNTTSGALGTLVDSKTVALLPLNGRNYIDLAFLQAGVQMDSSTGSGGTTSRGTMMNSNGANFRANNYLLDGAPMQTLNGNSSGDLNMRTLGVEGIREYRVVTNSFSAEYGLRMGAQAIFVSKNGTNQLHGSGFEYLRNSALDARNFFDYRTSTTPRRIPNLVRNNFGGSLGGPILKDKMFFHLVYEGLKETQAVTRAPQRTIPLAARVDGGVVPVIAASSRPFLQLFPLPNFPGDFFAFAPSDRSGEDHGQARADYNFSESDQIFARYTTTHSFRKSSHALSPDHWVIDDMSENEFSTLSETHTFSPALLGTFRISHSFIHIRETTGNEVVGPEFSFRGPGSVMGSLAVSPYPGIGTGATNGSIHKQHIITGSGDLYYTLGSHSLKLGTLINRFRLDFESPNNNVGSVAFANLSNFLLGIPQSISARAPDSDSTGQFRYTTLGFYVQDDFRVNSRFTLNAGLRYEFNTNIRETRGREANFRDMQRDEKTTVGPVMENFSLRNFGPRLGFAWDPSGSGMTSLRGGFGLLYDIMNVGGALYQAQGGTPPWSVFLEQGNSRNEANFRVPLAFTEVSEIGPSLRVLDYRMEQPHMLQYNVTAEHQLPWSMAATLSYAGSRGFNLLRTREGNPRIPIILPDGSKFFPTPVPARVNPRFASIELKVADSNSWYNSMQFSVVKRLSNRLQFQSAYTWAHVLDEGQAVYSNEASRFPSDPDDRTRDRSSSGFDIRHNWKLNTIYLLPEHAGSSGLVRGVLNGWWISTIFSAETGYPHEVVLGVNRSRSGNLGENRANIDRPNLKPGRTPDDITSGTSPGCLGVAPGTEIGTRELYFDPCAFTLQPAGSYGDLGRNFLRRPGLYNLDFSLAKDTAAGFLGEAGKVEFRADFFNILNHTNFQLGKETRLFTGNAVLEEAPIVGAGEMRATSNKSRQIQLSLRLEF
jgi:hypothetical protein